MKEKGKRLLWIGCIFIAGFAIWTLLIQAVDVQPLGVNGINIGFATINCWFHRLIGVHMMLYTITDWLGLIPIFICMIFGVMGLVQLIQRRSLLKVDYDIIFLISVLAVLLLAMTRESYAVVVAFLLLVIKGCLLFEYAKIGG